MPVENWDDLRFLLALSRTGSCAAAGRHLGVNETTVARRLRQAELHLQAALFEKGPEGLVPTAAGLEVLRRAETVELEIESAAGAISGRDARVAGSVRLTAVPLLVNRLLTPALPLFLARHPELHIDLIAEPRDLSLTRREADIALRLARPRRDARAVARRIGQLAYAVYGPAARATENLPWITYDDSLCDLPQARWIAESLARAGDRPAQLQVNDAEGLLAAVKAGLGKSLLPVAIGAGEPGLVRIGDCPAALTRELWLMVHPEMRGLARIRAVMDWLLDTAEGLAPGG